MEEGLYESRADKAGLDYCMVQVMLLVSDLSQFCGMSASTLSLFFCTLSSVWFQEMHVNFSHRLCEFWSVENVFINGDRQGKACTKTAIGYLGYMTDRLALACMCLAVDHMHRCKHIEGFRPEWFISTIYSC